MHTLLATTLAFSLAAPGDANVDLPRYPAVSPDGSAVSFSWRGDLWRAPVAGGTALRLTSHPSDELRSAWSGDGDRIAFESMRDGYRNLYVMNADGTGIRPLTNVDASLTLTGFGAALDGEEVVTFSSRLEGDLYRGPRCYEVPTAGGPIRRVHDAFGDHPVTSADGTRVAFTRGGSSWSRRHYRGPDARDVWMFDRGAGVFSELTTWTGNDGQATWRDASTLLFLSDREFDTVNLYRMNAVAGDESAVRLTSFDETDIIDFDVSADGTTVVLHAWDTLYALDLADGNATPQPIAISAPEDSRDGIELKPVRNLVTEARLSPDGQVMACVAYGEVFVRNVDDNKPTRRVTHSAAREHGIAWSPDGLRLYFTSDRDGNDSIYAARVEMTREDVRSRYKELTEPPQPEAEPEEEAEEEAEDPADPDEPADDADDAGDDEDGDGSGDDDDADDDADGDADEDEDVEPEFDPSRWHDALRFAIEPVVVAGTEDRDPVPSPDGRSLAFRRGRGDLVVLDIETGAEQVIATGWDTGIETRWHPDSEYVAYTQYDLDFNADIWIAPVDGSFEAINITRHPDNDGDPRWSADGKIIAFLSERTNEEYDVWAVNLDRSLDAYSREQRAEYHDKAAKAASKRKPPAPRKPEADDADDEQDDEADAGVDEPGLDLDDLRTAYRRVRRITSLAGSESNVEMTPGGDRIIFAASGELAGLHSVDWAGQDRKRLRGPASVQEMTLNGSRLVYVAGGQAGTVKPGGGDDKTIGISDTITIDLAAQSSQKFLEAARILGANFYHPTMKDLDWSALSEAYHDLARRARTASEFNDVAARFLGELNGSHLGIRARDPGSPVAQPVGRLGASYEPAEDGFRVLEILPDSPAATGETPLVPGDIIIAIEGTPVGPRDTMSSRLEGRVGRETLVTVRRDLDRDGVVETVEIDALLKPIGSGAERALKYDDYQRRTAALVDEMSDGRIGYIHIQGMNQRSLDEYERDLYAAAAGRDGLLIDVRNNGGGWTTDRLLASIMAPVHAYTIPRGAEPRTTGHYPQDRLFIQRYTMPINMLCNEKSFSNAEIISHAFKTLGRGTLVGQQTYGGVISTGGTTLIDGTFVRLPFRGWYLNDGTDMENNGAIPDIIVEQTPEAESRNDDEQLRAAVDDLMRRLDDAP